MTGPLEGVRVIDMTSVGMGPMATQLLGDMGADIIKIEAPDGDVFRHVTPQRNADMSHAFLNLNRNKRSVVLDLKRAEDLRCLRELIGTADVFVSNIRAKGLQRLGLDYASLEKDHPRLIHCVCYGYSDEGPYAGRAAIDDTIQAACGLAWLQGEAKGGRPHYVNSVVADKAVGLYVSNAIAVALFARERMGMGQAIEVPMFEAMVAFVVPEHLSGLTFVPPEGGGGYARILNEFRRPFKTKDGYIAVAPYTGAQWTRFFRLAGHPQLATDPRYGSATARSRHFSELYRFVESVILDRTTEEWLELLERHDLPFAAVNSIADLINDRHLVATKFWTEIEHPTEGHIRLAGMPIKLSRTPARIRRHAPSLGEHTDEVRREKS